MSTGTGTKPYALALSRGGEAALGRTHDGNVKIVKGQALYRVAPGDTLAVIARKFKRSNREATNLQRMNRIPAGRPLQVGAWIKIPTVWARPARARARMLGARALMGCFSCNKSKNRGKDPRALGAWWWESYDSCPEGATPVIDEEGDIIDCTCPAGSVFDEDAFACVTDGGGGGGGGGGGSGDDLRDPSDYLEPNGAAFEPGIYPGYYDDRDGQIHNCPAGHAYFEDYFACLPYEKKGGGGGGSTNTGGGGSTNTGGGGSPGGGGTTTTSTTSTATEKSAWQKIAEFLKKPVVIGGAVAVAVVGAGIYAKKKSRKSS